MKKYENNNSKKSLVECPFCGIKVNAKSLAKHAKLNHAKLNHANSITPKRDHETENLFTIEGIEIHNSELAQQLNQLVVDENGFLINPKLLQDEPRISLNEVLGTVPKPKQKVQKIKKEQQNKAGSNRQHKSIDELYREKEEWLRKIPQLNAITKITTQNASIICPVCKAKVKPKRLWRHFAKCHQGIQLTNEQIHDLENGETIAIDLTDRRLFKKNGFPSELRRDAITSDEYVEPSNLVKCPLCKHKAFYNVLFTHIQVSHPEVNPKIVMAKFNRVYRNKDKGDKTKYEQEMDNMIKDYEKLKQSQDESRDGGKYLGFMRRESGKFGSLPLYDDYSDESNAE